MNDLKIFLWSVFLIFTLICVAFCIEAHLRYHNRRGIDEDKDFSGEYQYFVQTISNRHGAVIGYELLLRELDAATQQWRLPNDVVHFPLSKMVEVIKKLVPRLHPTITLLSMNMTVRQLTDFRADYFLRWVNSLINDQDLVVEIDAHDILTAGLIRRRHLLHFLKNRDRRQVKVTVENVDSARKSYLLLQQFLPYIDYLKLNARAFRKSETHWIDVTLAQWQRQLAKYKVTPVVGRVEDADQVALANRLNINLRQGYHYGRPQSLETD